MALFPPETSFFINSWTWGYEDIFRAIAYHFQSQIHVDRYKHSVYSHIADPFMRSLITLDPSKTRFHACERFNRCQHASADDVVYINPVTIGKVKWEQYRLLTESKLRLAQPVTVLVRPLSSHCSLFLFLTHLPASSTITSLASQRTPCIRLSLPPCSRRTQYPRSIPPRPRCAQHPQYILRLHFQFPNLNLLRLR
jgi:hypothetical protein